jgi:hypothetical protein
VRQLTRLPRTSDGPSDTGDRESAAATPRRPAVLAIAIALSWLVPLVLGLVRLDAVLLPVLLLAVASVIRVGGGLLDRLVVAAFMLCGAVLTFGLVASVWPWGLDPAPAAAVLLTLRRAAAWSGRRPPALPWRVRGTDAIILGTGAVVWYFVHKGVSGKAGIGEMMAGDRFTHFSIYDTIHRVHGYLFLHQAASGPSVIQNTAAVYPEGSHFLLAWTDVFLRSSTSTGPMNPAFERYCTYILLAFVAFNMTVVWAARWVAGPRLHGWRMAAVCSVVAGLLVASPMVWMLQAGFDSEIVGLAFLALAVALLVRPAMGRVEFTLATMAGLITVGYSYNVYLVYVGIALLVTLAVRWRKDRGHRLAVYVPVAVGGAVAVLPSLISVFSAFSVSGQAAAGGQLIDLSRSLVIGVALVVLVSLLASMSGPRRTAPAQVMLVTLVGGAVVLALFGGWQLETVGKLSYYFEKLTFAGFVICLSGLGAVGALLRPMKPSRAGANLLHRLQQPMVAVGVTAVSASLLVGFQWGVPSVAGRPAAWHTSPLAGWSQGKLTTGIGPSSYTFRERDLNRVTAPVLTLYTDSGDKNWRTSYFAQALLHRAGEVTYFPSLYQVNMGATYLPEDSSRYQASLASLQTVVKLLDDRPTILVGNRQLADQIARDLNGGGRTVAHVVFAPLLRY